MSDALDQLKKKNGGELEWLELVVQHVNSLNYGVVEIIVHDSRVTQIEKTERVRLENKTGRQAERK